jgi:hypothetical protein
MLLVEKQQLRAAPCSAESSPSIALDREDVYRHKTVLSCFAKIMVHGSGL